MYKRFSDLQFVIGLFFFIVSLILLGNDLLNDQLTGQLNLYTGLVFLVFGVLMILVKGKKNTENES